jgi:hypothetical protein
MSDTNTNSSADGCMNQIGVALLVGIMLLFLEYHSGWFQERISRTSSNPPAAAQTNATVSAARVQNTEPANWPLVVRDSFDDNHLGWPEGSFSYSEIKGHTNIVHGEYITYMKITRKNYGVSRLPKLPSYSNVYFSVDTRFDSRSSVQLALRFGNKDYLYSFGSCSDQKSYFLGAFEKEAWKDVIPCTKTELIRPDQTNTYAMAVRNDQLLLFINNTLVRRVILDRKAIPGRVYLFAGFNEANSEGTVFFDNFEVRVP